MEKFETRIIVLGIWADIYLSTYLFYEPTIDTSRTTMIRKTPFTS